MPVVRMMPRIIEYLGYDPYPPPQSLGERIAAGRRRCGLSRKRLARLIGADEATVARWESGLAKPNGERFRQLMAVIGLIT